MPYLLAARLGLRAKRGTERIDCYIDALAEAADLLVETQGATVVFLPRYPAGPWPDVAYLRSAVRRMRHADRAFILEGDDYRVSPELPILIQGPAPEATAQLDRLRSSLLYRRPNAQRFSIRGQLLSSGPFVLIVNNRMGGEKKALDDVRIGRATLLWSSVMPPGDVSCAMVRYPQAVVSSLGPRNPAGAPEVLPDR